MSAVVSEFIDDSHVVTSGEAATGLKTLRFAFGGNRRVHIKSMSIYDVDTPWLPCSIGITIGGRDLGLAVGCISPHEALHQLFDLKVTCSGFWWVVNRPQTGDTLRFEALWEVIK